MKGELKIQRDPTRRKFRCPVWTVTLFAWEFPLDKFRKRVVAAIRKMDGFVGWCDPKVFFHEDDRGMLYFALFDSQAHAEAARDLIRAEFPRRFKDIKRTERRKGTARYFRPTAHSWQQCTGR